MIELQLPSQVMDTLRRFLDSAEDGEVLSSVQRGQETILYFRKNSSDSANRLAARLLAGRRGTDDFRPVLRLVSNDEAHDPAPSTRSIREKRFLLANRMEQVLPGSINSAAARSLATRQEAEPARQQRPAVKRPLTG